MRRGTCKRQQSHGSVNGLDKHNASSSKRQPPRGRRRRHGPRSGGAQGQPPVGDGRNDCRRVPAGGNDVPAAGGGAALGWSGATAPHECSDGADRDARADAPVRATQRP